MAKIYFDDTIAAIATPIGEGAIAVIRVSGPDAIATLDKLFRGKTTLSDASGFTAHYGRLVDLKGSPVDEVIVTLFREPHSYTGENVVEVSCHGGLYNTQKVLETVLSAGVRRAEPGEFTKRAFLNGKMDLSQAEAVADLIAARSEASHHSSLNLLEGKFSDQINGLRTKLVDLSSMLELELDFAEEGIELLSQKEVAQRIQTVKAKIEEMVRTYQIGKVYREGASVAIIGKPNAGKSSLFNALLKENRAIVTPIPGTTRDSLEESISIGGVLFRLSDTAGIRDTSDAIELEGVSRTRKLVSHADVLLLVIDASSGPDRSEAISFLQSIQPRAPVVVVYNKIDLCELNGGALGEYNFGDATCVEVQASALTGFGLDEVRDNILRFTVGASAGGYQGIQAINSRHKSALEAARTYLTKAELSLQNGASAEFVALDVRSANDCLAEIVGEISTEETLNNIFSRFCIGK